MLLQSDLAGERSQFATENKTASERTFVRFFSTKHESLRITVGLNREQRLLSAAVAARILKFSVQLTTRRSVAQTHEDTIQRSSKAAIPDKE
ncbi:hypothetical protein Tco_1426126 [Tanacetum coccineum]